MTTAIVVLIAVVLLGVAWVRYVNWRDDPHRQWRDRQKMIEEEREAESARWRAQEEARAVERAQEDLERARSVPEFAIVERLRRIPPQDWHRTELGVQLSGQVPYETERYTVTTAKGAKVVLHCEQVAQNWFIRDLPLPLSAELWIDGECILNSNSRPTDMPSLVYDALLQCCHSIKAHWIRLEREEHARLEPQERKAREERRRQAAEEHERQRRNLLDKL